MHENVFQAFPSFILMSLFALVGTGQPEAFERRNDLFAALYNRRSWIFAFTSRELRTGMYINLRNQLSHLTDKTVKTAFAYAGRLCHQIGVF